MTASAALDNTNIIGGNVKRARFDRQLRLWGADEQAALEAAHVVAIGATPAIAEALKSLVLTGVPVVTLVDERIATAQDVAANFFVSAASAGTPLATSVLRNVCALGEPCTGLSAVLGPGAWVKAYAEAVEQDWQAGHLHSSMAGADGAGSICCASSGIPAAPGAVDASAVRRFVELFPAVTRHETSPSSSRVRVPLPSLILVSERYRDLSSTSVLVQTCLTRCYRGVPVMLVRSSGLLGFLQVYSPPRVILRPHNPTKIKMEDLRIFEPFPALKAWFDAHHPDDNTQFPTSNTGAAMSLHSHLPYPCILHHAFHRWWSSLSSAARTALQRRPLVSASPAAAIFPLPAQSYRDIAGIVAAMIRRPSPPEDAFIEAMEKCTAMLNRSVVQQLPEGLYTLFHDPRCADPLLAVAEWKARLSPVVHTGGAPTTPLPASVLQLLWTNEEVLVWFVLHAAQLFVKGEIGCDVKSEEAGECRYVSSTASTPQPGAGSTDQESEAVPVKADLPSSRVSLFHLPFAGYVPDFNTTTTWYRELQDIYRAKHLEDVSCIADKAWEVVARAIKATAANTDALNGRVDTPKLHEQLGRAVKPLLTKYTAMIVENIWDLRIVAFSADYLATQEMEWQRRLGHRIVDIVQNSTDDADGNAGTRRAACMAAAYLCKEELQRSADVDGSGSAYCRITGQEIMKEAIHLASLAKMSKPEPADATGPLEVYPAWCGEGAAAQKMFAMSCEEVARWTDGAGAATQLPSVAASTGALAAQEAVKFITRTRVPCGQPIMYDGYTNKVHTL